MEIQRGPGGMAAKVVEIAWTLLGHRCWSMAVRHHEAPNVYMGLTSPNPDTRKAAASLMKQHWERLMAFEQRSLEYDQASKLNEDLIICK